MLEIDDTPSSPMRQFIDHPVAQDEVYLNEGERNQHIAMDFRFVCGSGYRIITEKSQQALMVSTRTLP